MKIGDVFGEWTVIGDVFHVGKPRKRRKVRCRCSCGVERDVFYGSLVRGKTSMCTSCGSKIGRIHCIGASEKHGCSGTKEYRAWIKMQSRCKEDDNYIRRGIFVCDEWCGDGGFERFFDHIGPAPSDELSVDRIDNDRGYEPGNVRWATRKVQLRNKSTNRLLTINGETKCIADWSDESGVKYETIRARLRYGWDEKSAVFTEPLIRRG